MIDVPIDEKDAMWAIATGFARRADDDPAVLELTDGGAQWLREWMRDWLYRFWREALYGDAS